MKYGLILLAITIILVGVCGCTQTPTPSPVNVTSPLLTTESPTVVITATLQKTPMVSDNTIRIKKLAFDPANITVKVGSTVRWVNQDSVPHRIMFADGTYSQTLAASDSWSRKIDSQGTYNYICSIHPEMHGTVIVE